MRQFFKFALASCLGIFIAGICLFILGLISFGSLLASDSEKIQKLKPNTILEVKFESSVPELTDNVEKNPFESGKTIGVHDMIAAIKKAETDDNIKGIIINTRFVSSGYSTISILRGAIEAFKKSGKFVYAYGDLYTQGAYYLASVADSVIVNPSGGVDFRGMGAVIPFMKNLFEKIDLKWNIYYAGQFKSATEPLRLDKMSEQNRFQLHEYINGMYDVMLADMSKSRNLPLSELRRIADNYLMRTANDALQLKMVDKVAYYDEVLGMLRQRLNLGKKDKLSSIDLSDYAENRVEKPSKSKDKIAVLYAEGDIDYNNLNEENGTIEGARYAKIIRKLRQDDNVKAIVLRVNSGGGSSFASDIIWRELTLARQQGKVVVASFGDYAASGGYYIAMASDSIFAEKNTLTGSIGVFGAIPIIEKTMRNKLGITFDTVKTGKYSVGFGSIYDHTPDEAKIIQVEIDSIYETFLQRVATNRKMTRDQVHNIAQGRIWHAPKAVEIGLVDRIGNLEDAIAAAAAKAGLSDYKEVSYPKFKNSFEKFIENMTGEKPKDGIAKTAIKIELGELYPYYEQFMKMQKMKGVQMRLPYAIHVR